MRSHIKIFFIFALYSLKNYALGIKIIYAQYIPELCAIISR